MRVIISRRMIREGLFRLLAKKKISEISITELCKEAQVNRTTFYHHYEIPQDVLAEVSWNIVKEVEKVFDGYNPKNIRQKTINALSILQEHKDELKIIFAADTESSSHDMAIEAFSHFWNSQFDLKNTLQLNDEEYHFAIIGYGWSGYHVIKQWIMEDSKMSPEDLLALFEKMFSKTGSRSL